MHQRKNCLWANYFEIKNSHVLWCRTIPNLYRTLLIFPIIRKLTNGSYVELKIVDCRRPIIWAHLCSFYLLAPNVFSAPSYKLAAFRFPLVVLQCQSSTQTPPGRAQGRAPNIKRLKYVSRPGQKEKDGHIKGAGIFHSATWYWVSIWQYWLVLGQYKLVLLGIRWYRVSKGLVCLYILEKVEIWSGVTDASLTDRQTTEYSATQLVYSIKFKLSHAM